MRDYCLALAICPAYTIHTPMKRADPYLDFTKPPKTPQTFGSYLRKLRSDRGVAQKKLSHEFGKNKMTAWLWEAGRFLPSQQKLPLIKKALGLSQKEFARLSSFYREEQRNRSQERFLHSARLERDAAGAEQEYHAQRVPLIGPRDAENPKYAWRSEDRLPVPNCVFAPLDLPASSVFAFKITESAMTPKFNLGDILFCNYRLKPQDGKAVVCCVGNSVLCRIFERHGRFLTFKAIDPKVKSITVVHKKCKWLYPVVMWVSKEM